MSGRPAMTGVTPPATFAALKQAIAERHAGLPKRLRQAADYAIRHPEEMALGTTATIAAEIGIQPSALVRLAQALGFAGYSDMKQIFLRHLKDGWPDHRERLAALARSPSAGVAMDHLAGFAQAAATSLERLKSTVSSERLEAAVATLAAAETIYILAARRMFPVGAYLAYAFSRSGTRAVLVDHVGMLGPEQMAFCGARDAVLAASCAPYAPATVALAAEAAGRGVPVVAITDSALSPLIPLSRDWLEVSEADYGAFRSLAATFALAMALTVAIGERRTRDAGSFPPPVADGPA